MALKPDATASSTSCLVASFFQAVPYMKDGTGISLYAVKAMARPPTMMATEFRTSCPAALAAFVGQVQCRRQRRANQRGEPQTNSARYRRHHPGGPNSLRIS